MNRIALILFTLAAVNLAEAEAIVDCPLRDEAYSLETPLLDALLKPEARALLQHSLPGFLERMPPEFATPPTLAASLSVRAAAAMAQVSEERRRQIDVELRALPISDYDRRARCARYDVEKPRFEIPKGKPRVLLFEKVNGFLHAEAIPAARAAFTALAQRRGWSVVVTDKGGAIDPATLKKFDVIVFNNVSGDVLTLTQRVTLQRYIENGGGFLGIHGAGGDHDHPWTWYVDTLIGAPFAGHPMNPQFQDARLVLESGSEIVRDLPPQWIMNDEWYSFSKNPRANGARVLLTLDEASYSLVNEQHLRMGDHPIAWTRCVGDGRSLYSSIGHRAATYSDPTYLRLLERGLLWAAGHGETRCRGGAAQPPPAFAR